MTRIEPGIFTKNVKRYTDDLKRKGKYENDLIGITNKVIAIGVLGLTVLLDVITFPITWLGNKLHDKLYISNNKLVQESA